MSFDLAVWHETAPITAAAALGKYQRLCDSGPGTDIAPRPEVAAFYRDLVDQYPDLRGTTDVRKSPWSTALDVYEDAVIMPIVWRRATQVSDVVRELAERHGLICFDPQEVLVHHPLALRAEPAMTLSLWDGAQIESTEWEYVERSLRKLSPERFFVILEGADGHYVQVGFGKQAGTRAGTYALERREGSADRHYRCVLTDLDRVIDGFKSFAAGENGWHDRFDWQRVEFS